MVDTKQRFGDWKVDTVIGKQDTGAIVGLVERKSGMCVIRKVPTKIAEDVWQVVSAMLLRYRHHVHTITEK